MADNFANRTYVPLQDDDPISGQKFFCMSMVSPENPKQKSKVHALKIRYVCEEEEEARQMCTFLQKKDPYFDVYVGGVGKWLPVVENPLDIPNVEYQQSALTELVMGQKNNQDRADFEYSQRVEEQKDKIRQAATREGQRELAERREPAASVLYKIRQLQNVINVRQRELDNWTSKYNTYNEDERTEAEALTLPEVKPVPFSFDHQEF